ncbi:peptidoglycan-binding protein [Patescibacteria group bacterium]|nr:peptidoglycan-binding protein [Patescibacteria group bacterium]MBP7841342.1 peptidoglycan-binding protein [Patescibacteria group bacterium]
MKANDTYAFVVQAGLDAVSKENRYENLLLGADGKYGVDDNYGPRTRAAVKQFQTDACFAEKDIDGIVGPKTMEALVKVLK